MRTNGAKTKSADHVEQFCNSPRHHDCQRATNQQCEGNGEVRRDPDCDRKFVRKSKTQVLRRILTRANDPTASNATKLGKREPSIPAMGGAMASIPGINLAMSSSFRPH